MISGATESAFIFLKQYYDFPEDVIVDFNPQKLSNNTENKIKILWAHSNCDQYIYKDTNWKNIDHIVCVSEWEKNEFVQKIKIPKEKITVIRNGGADYFTPKKEKSKTLIYTSTPFRGLYNFLEIFPLVLKKHPDAKLKIFSSMSLYGHTQDEFTELYNKLKSIRNVEYSPAIEHEELVKEYQDAMIFCYPNTWEETSCVSLIEAMRCGCYPILSDLGALKETSGGFGKIVPMSGKNYTDGWIPDNKFIESFADAIIGVFNDYKYDDRITNFACNYYDWKIIALEWKKLIDNLKGKNMSSDIVELQQIHKMPSAEIVKDAKVLDKVYEEVFKWDQYDREHAQTRTNFQIEKFIALDSFTIPSTFLSLLKNRKSMAEGLFSKVIEMKERQRSFDRKWDDKPKDVIDHGEGRYSWYDLESLAHESYMKNCEIEIKDRVQQIEFFDKLLSELIQKNGGPITKEQVEQTEHVYWERRFANQMYDDILSKSTGISVGNLQSIRRATAPTLDNTDLNRIKSDFPELGKLFNDQQQEFIMNLQDKVIDGIKEVTGKQNLSLENEKKERLENNTSENLSPKKLFNQDYVRK